MKTGIQITPYGQRQMCRIRFSEKPAGQWLSAFLSRCDSHPTETTVYDDPDSTTVILFRDRFRDQFSDLVSSAAKCVNELDALGML